MPPPAASAQVTTFAATPNPTPSAGASRRTILDDTDVAGDDLVAAGYPVGTFEPACVVVEEAEGPEAGFTRPTCETQDIKYLATVDATGAEDTLLGVLNGD